MEHASFTPKTVRFGAFEVDLATAELRKNGTRLRLQEQPFKVLSTLLEQPGAVVPREELVRRLWPDGTFVDFDRGLNAAVTRLRQVLSDSAENPRYVETVARRGYRFLAPIELNYGPIGTEIEGPPRQPGPYPVQPRLTLAKRRAWIAIGAAAVVLTIAISVLLFRNQHETTLEQITRDPGLASDPALSADGKLLAYASDRGGQNLNIWVKQLVSGGKAVQLTHDGSDAHQPCFSPDGLSIVYRSEREGGGMYVIPAIGGEAQFLVLQGRNPRYSPDGKWIAYWTGALSGSAPEAAAWGTTYVMPASGGEAKRIGADLPPGGYPIWSSDSKRLLVYANPRVGPSAVDADWWIVSVEGGNARKTGSFESLKSQGFSIQLASAIPRASAWVDNSLTFSAQKGDSRNIWQVQFKDGSVSNHAERLTQGTTLDAFPSSGGRGSLVFASLSQGMAIWSLPVNANDARVTGDLERVTEGSTLEVTPSISADGRLLVYGSTVPNREDIWLKDLQTGRETAVASTAAAEWHPTISRDGSMIAYTVDDASLRAIYVVPATGGKPRQVAQGSGWIFDWTPDRQYLLFHSKTSDPNLKRLSLASGIVSDYLGKPGAAVYQSRFSPDGEWLAFEGVFETARDSSADSRVFIVKLENGAPAPGRDWILIGDEHGWTDKPRWSPDGKTLYFISERDGFRCIWAQRLDPATKIPIGNPFAIYHFHNRRVSMMNVGTPLLEIDVAKDKIVMNLGELTGNIWSLSQR